MKAASALALSLLTTAAHADISCVADFSAFGQGSMTVEIKPAALEGRFDAVVNGRTTHAGMLPVDETIRPGLNFAVDAYGSEFKQFNSAERSLVHLHRLSEAPSTRDLIKLPFAPADVRRIKTFDLVGKMDKFGGQVLMEAFDERGASLGKVVRRALVATCR
ncbi:hypothetical protein J2X20_001595 [Pelomonas saccharophila]|uniref:Uncharacterized protein n=1 Tax=Roseateles saccharophilus TaxID=304 RepID=A0ABU1YJD4_ROSSA|nr:hypothetical protein [Roseateles saccharophilus]MDR7268966.1 hypothetical protein [Roseateles saccharophilus]